jgi:phosphoribosyl-ATP pyrophosphohydrolase
VVAVIPVLVLNENGAAVAVSVTNEKGHGKSLETGRLWHVHQDTGRLLPLEIDGAEVELSQLDERSGWLEAWTTLRGKPTRERISVPRAGERAQTETRSGDRDGERSADDATSTRRFSLAQLERLVQQRKRTMPEGSYTTHLFREGPEKIRKKLGEEAVELILTRGQDDLIHESADLVYHLLVLLAAESSSFDEVLFELARRHSSEHTSG